MKDRRVLLPLEVDVAHIGIVTNAPDLQAVRCPADRQSSIVARRCAAVGARERRNFLETQTTVQESADLQLGCDALGLAHWRVGPLTTMRPVMPVCASVGSMILGLSSVGPLLRRSIIAS